jgi:hypothetical protein
MNWYLGVRGVVCWVRYVVLCFRGGGWGDGDGDGGGHVRLRKRRRQYRVHRFTHREIERERSGC